MLISFEGTDKNQLELVQKCGRCFSVGTVFFAINSLPKPTGMLEHCREGETKSVASTFFGAFRFDCVPKAMKDFSARCFIYGNNSCKLYQQIRGNF